MTTYMPKTLVSMICEDFDDLKITRDHLYQNGGAVECEIVGSIDDGDELIDVLMLFSVPTTSLSYSDDKINVDKAVVDFEVLVAGVTRKTKEKPMQWLDKKRYCINTDPDRVNVALFFNGAELTQPTNTDTFYCGDLPPSINKDDDDYINEHVCRTVAMNSNEKEIVAAIEECLRSLDVCLSY